MNAPNPAVATALAALCAALADTGTPVAPDAPPAEPEFTGVAEFAQRRRVSVKTVRRMLDDGMPHERVRRRLIRIEVAKAEAWIGRNTDRGSVERATRLGRVVSRRGTQ